MSINIDPLAAAARIERDYRSYLSTSFAPLDAALRHEFDTALQEPARLRKGPYLQATPPYETSTSIDDLVDQGLLSGHFRGAGPSLSTDRKLYLHQEHAIRTICSGANAIVATGTGSGKTECYLLPVLDHLLRERDAGTISEPGVRALLLYPMNALANDQLKRIREMFAPFPDLTFGRYVGDTKHTRDKALDTYRRQLGSDPLPGELIDRETMQQRPPHVLLTNFAMLEYLLLRPQDSTLFDGPTGRHWRFVVLDEVHVYDGAKGAEVGMLLRRVRDRVHSSVRGKLRCIGTSATLGGGAKDSGSVAEFAEALFDERFDPSGVIHPTRRPLAQSHSTWALSPSHLDRLHAAWLESGSPSDLIAAADRTRDCAPGPTVEATLWRLLCDEGHVVELQNRLEQGSRSLEMVTDVFPEAPNPRLALVKLVDLCVAARRDQASAPLIPARYHLWLRASEGSFVCLHPSHPEGVRRIRLDRFEACPECSRVGVDATMNELAVCRHCRRHLLVGRLVDNVFALASAFEPHLVHLLPGASVAPAETLDEDEEALLEAGDTSTTEKVLCLGCRRLADHPESCECTNPSWIQVTQLDRPGAKLKRCPVCERRSQSGVALRFLSGSEAPVSVVATSLYQSLPPVSRGGTDVSAEGRKLLMFSDSRQDAAFFAPYLSRTYGRALERRLVWQRLSSSDEPMAFEELVLPVRRHAERLGVLDPDVGARNSATVKAWLLAEVLATDRRQSLDGVGLAEITAPIPGSAEPPTALLELGFDRDEAFDVVRVLLDSVRQSAAVTLPDEVDVEKDQRFAPRNTSSWIRGAVSSPGVLAWLPSRGSNRRLDYLERLFRARTITTDPRRILDGLWAELTAANGPYRRVLTSHDVRQHGTVFALDHESLLFIGRHAGAEPRRCTVCRQVAWRDVAGVCPSYRCNGRLAKVDTEEPQHYRMLYEGLDPFELVVEEHTGQLRSETAADLQEKFIRGSVNALSCSTTFELGVDVGDVQAVLMRNVPPSPANYVQRAGRAGRRLGAAALVVSFAQRRSHDRAYYDEPRQMIDGVIPAPCIAVDNDAIVRRHVHAVAYAMFERQRAGAGSSPLEAMGDLLASSGSGTVAEEFESWLRGHPAELKAALQRIIPPERDGVGVDSWDWVELLFSPDESGVGGWFANVVESLDHDLEELSALEEEQVTAKRYGKAAEIQRAQRTLRERRVLDRLAQGGVLPKYGFPVDVVELDVSRSSAAHNLELNRDLRLAMLEFAPGAKVVAANKLWLSVGVKLMPGRDLPMREWGVCAGCGCLRSALTIDETERRLDAPCSYCGSTDFLSGRRGRFITPMFGFVGKLADEPPGDSRPPREGFLETYFAEFDGQPPEPEFVDLGGVPISVRMSRRGWITVFNRGRSGRGFWYCSWCGHTQDEPPKRSKKNPQAPPHVRPLGERECRGSLRQVDLGHRFITNVMELDLPITGSGWSEQVAATSAMHALIAAAPEIGIAPNDIGGSLAVGAAGQRVVVIFDDVPGGAGYSRHLRANLNQLVESALRRVQGCSCGEDTSCYGCLRSFRNQQQHDLLVRQAAMDVLEPMVGV